MAAKSSVLSIWLYGRNLGELERLRDGGMRLRFVPEAVGRYGLGGMPLSLSLPLTDKRVQGPVLHRYLDNLLPESAVRRQLERDAGVRPNDVFGLLGVIGAECAGAVQFTAGDAGPPVGYLESLDADEVNRIVAGLPTLVPPDDLPISASLGGIQAKVLLTRTADGWAWPADGAVSTHIVKPEPVNDGVSNLVPSLVRHEAWALDVARSAGIPAARAEILEFDGREAIVVERYDRRDGRRIHQEDFAQALAISAAEKYEGAPRGAGRLHDVVTAASGQSLSPRQLATDVLTVLAFNVMIGNGDAHAKNYSFLIDEQGKYTAAPLYDVAPVFLISSRYHHSGFAVNGTNRLDYLTGAHLVAEGQSWGMESDEAVAVVTRVRESVEGAIDTVPVDYLPVDLRPLVRERLKRFVL